MNTNIETYTANNDGFSISSSKVTGFFSMPEKHVHEKYEIYYLVSGERYYFIKDRFFKIKKGHLVFVNQGELHKTTDADLPDHERILVYFKRDFVATSNGSMDRLLDLLHRKNHCVLGLSLKEQQVVEKIIQDMNEEILKQSLGFETCLQGLLMKLLVFIARTMEHYDEHAYVSIRPKHEKVSEVVQYINAHYSELLAIPRISELFYISPYYLSRIFKETTGFTLVEYVNNVRVREAQKLLSDKSLKVIQVAELSGFGSVANFNRIFKDLAGCSPLNYRKSLK
ncbi:MAG: AraC family transcriptional regulator [Clostridia bacterium]|nr:AraC family transcriptional regulator [Clostridia bacterium]